jgi:hypothetical protein
MPASPALPEPTPFSVTAGVDLAISGAREKIRELIPRLADDQRLADGPLELKAGSHWVLLEVTREEFNSLRGKNIPLYEGDESIKRASNARRRSAGAQVPA